MKIRVNEYLLQDKNVKKEKNLASIADIHGNTLAMNLIVKLLKEYSLNYICLVGDTVDCKKDENKTELVSCLKELNRMCYVFLSMGNHEIYEKDIYLYDRSKKIITENYLNFFKQLDGLTNCISFLNEFNSLELPDNIQINALNVPFVCYKYETKENFEQFLSTLNLEFDEDKFNILLSHSPNCILQNNIISYFKEMNLILSGHNHGGLVPTFLQDIIKGHKGIVGPYGKIFQNNSYGTWTNDNTSLIVNNGVTRISDTKLLGISDSIFMPEVDIVNIKPSNEHSLNLVRRKVYNVK